MSYALISSLILVAGGLGGFLLVFPDALTKSRMPSAAPLLFFDEGLSLITPPATFGKEPAHLARLVIQRQPGWSGAFFHLFQAAKKEHKSFMEAAELLRPSAGQLHVGLINVSYGHDQQGLRWALDLCETGGQTPEEAFHLIDEEAAAAGLFRHLSEVYVEEGEDLEALYDYCENVFTQGLIPSLLTECYFARFNVLRMLPFSQFLITNPRIIEILCRQPVDITSDSLLDEQRRKAVAWELFSRLVSPKIPSLDSRTIEQIAWLRQNKKRELDQLRLRCTLLSYELSPTATQAEMTAQVEKLIATRTSKEIADLFDLDNRSLREFTAGVLSDSSTWLACAGALGSLLSGHLEWTAAAAITVLSKFGAEAFKSAAARKERLRQNDFALLYFLRR